MGRAARWALACLALAVGLAVAVTAQATDDHHARPDVPRAAAATVAPPARTASAPTSTPTCFGAAARDPGTSCDDTALLHSVVPSPAAAERASNSPCTVVERVGRARACEFGAVRGPHTATFALVGDSHAVHWRPALEIVAGAERLRGLSLSRAGCPFSITEPKLPEPDRSACASWNADVLRWLRRHPEIGTLVVSQRVSGAVVHTGGRDTFNQRVHGYRAAWAALPASIRHIVVLRDTPKMRGTTLHCVREAIAAGRRAGPACAVPRSRALVSDPAVRAARTEPRADVIDMSEYLCGRRTCRPVIAGALVYKDVSHITRVYGTTMGPFLLRKWRAVTASW